MKRGIIRIATSVNDPIKTVSKIALYSIEEYRCTEPSERVRIIDADKGVKCGRFMVI
jgi:hypothetical protein